MCNRMSDSLGLFCVIFIYRISAGSILAGEVRKMMEKHTQVRRYPVIKGSQQKRQSVVKFGWQ